MISQLLSSLRRALPGASTASPAGFYATTAFDLRTEVCPPALLREAARPVGMRAWLVATWFDSSSAAPHRTLRQPVLRAAPLMAVRSEFADAIADLRADGAGTLTGHIRKARSLRELWHLRADVYSLIATHANEAEAQRRMARLNRHFATRSASARQG